VDTEPESGEALLGKCARELETRDRACLDENLPDRTAAVGGDGLRLVDLLLRHVPVREEDLADRTASERSVRHGAQLTHPGVLEDGKRKAAGVPTRRLSEG